MTYLKTYCSLFLLVVLLACDSSKSEKQVSNAQETKLILSSHSASNIANDLSSNALLKTSFDKVLNDADKALANGIELPIPKDPGGGYTHEKHKKNYADMYAAATIYSITKDEKYAKYVEDMLLQYAAMYPSLPLHPKSKENHPAGKLFWQGLNESVWLFYTIQAYDLVRSHISEENKTTIENQLLKNVAKFLSEDSYETFNKVHNHGTWSVAAVGMTGYVLEDKDMVERAIHGSKKDDTTGFLKQMNTLFSPDGYYSEGPYYQRYAMLPFIVFAEAIEENQPEIEIFKYRNNLLHKSVNTILQLTNKNGLFYPFNDAIKDKDFYSQELVFAANIAYERYKDENILPVIKAHNKVTLTNAGLVSAKAVQEHSINAYNRPPMLIKDGANGDQGGLALMRMPSSKTGQLNAVFKFASQGMGHGHFDRLSFMLYDDGREVLQDYGAARFLNVEAKEGGRYLPENKSFAKQTIAHNTLIVDETSQCNAKVSESEKHAPILVFSDLDNNNVQVVSAKETNAYEDVVLQRTMAMISLEDEQPFMLDIFHASSPNKHQYDLNFQYMGQLMDTGFNYEKEENLSPLGTKNGYQHLYKLASGKAKGNVSRLTFLQQNKFYSIATIADDKTEFILTQMGANDPNFNLRNEAGYIVRKQDVSNTTFVSIIEPHGNFNPKMETVQSPNSNLESLEIAYQDADYIAIDFKFKNGENKRFITTNKQATKTTNHTLAIDGETYNWQGVYLLKTQSK
ncbi:alginate lyase family protein [Bizionia sp.]|uniref:alginate lyase family protein n=1 Tax=Bizionia sp. TaxID=1954480 RepID=UPI003A9346C9